MHGPGDRLGGCPEKPEKARSALSLIAWAQTSATRHKASRGEHTGLGLGFLTPPLSGGEGTVFTPLVSLRFTADRG